MEKKNEDVEISNENEEIEDFDFGFDTDESGSKYSQMYWVKPYTKADPKNPPYFEVTKRVSGKYQKKKVEAIAGNLVSIKLNEYEYDNKPKRGLLFMFEKMNEDGNLEGMQLKCGWNKTLRSMCNSLLNVTKPIDKMFLKLYTNHKGDVSIMFKINGNPGNWKYKWEDIEPMRYGIKDSEGEVLSWDYKKMDKYFEDQILDEKFLSVILPNFNPNTGKEKATSPHGEKTVIVEKSMSEIFEADPDFELDTDEPVVKKKKK